MRSPVALAALLLAPALSACLAPVSHDPLAAPASTFRLAPGPFDVWNETVESFDGTLIAVTIHKPIGATANMPVPVILHTQGWGESVRGRPVGIWPGRCVACPMVTPFLDAGFGVVSVSPRGWSEESGESQAMDPEFEGQDALAVVDAVARLDWVLLDAPGDPRLGATGFSAGGLLHLLTALEETRRAGRTRLDAVNPWNTPHDLPGALSPNGVPKTVLWTLLVGVSAGADVAPRYRAAYAELMATGTVPSDVAQELHEHSPSWYVEQGVRLDVPLLVQQAPTDLHWPLNEGWAHFRDLLTPRAAAESLLVTHRNGHTYPWYRQQSSVLADNPCTGSGTWSAPDFQVRWFRKHLAREALDLGERVQLATHEGTCLWFDALPQGSRAFEVEPATQIGTPVALGSDARVFLRITDGPVTLAGIPHLRANVTAANPDGRLFFALAAGRSPTDVRVLGDQWTPVRAAATGTVPIEAPLAGVVEEIPAGSSVFLLVTGWHELYAAHASRAPGPAIVDDVRVDLPIMEKE